MYERGNGLTWHEAGFSHPRFVLGAAVVATFSEDHQGNREESRIEGAGIIVVQEGVVNQQTPAAWQ